MPYAPNYKRTDGQKSKVDRFDFRRPDRIPKSQLRAIYLLHDNFVRNLISSLSAYLRSFVVVNLVSIEQLSYAEFLEYLPTPTFLAALGLLPYDGHAVLEIDSSLVFPIIEMLLGGTARNSVPLKREATELELSLLDSLFQVILRELTEAWKGVTTIAFNIDCLRTDPKLLPIVNPSEAVVAIAIEIRIGDIVGMMNIAVPSIIVKMSRQSLDQPWSIRKAEVTSSEQSRVLGLILPAQVNMDARLEGPTLSMKDLLSLKDGDVLSLDFPVERLIGCRINGKLKFSGRIVAAAGKLGFQVQDRLCESRDPTNRPSPA